MGAIVMAKMGRPSNKGTDDETDVIRVSKKVASMIKLISRVKMMGTAQIVTPLIEAEVNRQYALIYPHLNAIKMAEDKSRAAQGLPPTEPLPAPTVVVIDEADTPADIAEKRAQTKKAKKDNKG